MDNVVCSERAAPFKAGKKRIVLWTQTCVDGLEGNRGPGYQRPTRAGHAEPSHRWAAMLDRSRLNAPLAARDVPHLSQDEYSKMKRRLRAQSAKFRTFTHVSIFLIDSQTLSKKVINFDPLYKGVHHKTVATGTMLAICLNRAQEGPW